MKIGIINIEPSINNTAYMQIACYYRSTGHAVVWWRPETQNQYSHVFCSSIFNYTDKSKIPEDVICGGTGFDVSSRLSRVIENSDLDYSIYPNCETSYIWFSRGCNRNCPWCVVQEKEGKIHPVRIKNLNQLGKSITVCDNSFFENPNWETAVFCLKEMDLPCDIQGIDVRTITARQAFMLSKLRRAKDKRIKIAWDDPFDEAKIIDGINRIIQYIRPHDLMCYVLIGFAGCPEQDLYRINLLRRFKISPFVMPFDKNDFYQKNFARWVNHKAVFNAVTWKKYFEQQQKKEKRNGRDLFECL